MTALRGSFRTTQEIAHEVQCGWGTPRANTPKYSKDSALLVPLGAPRAWRWRSNTREPTTMITAKLNHWTTYDRWGPSLSGGKGQRVRRDGGGRWRAVEGGSC